METSRAAFWQMPCPHEPSEISPRIQRQMTTWLGPTIQKNGKIQKNQPHLGASGLGSAFLTKQCFGRIKTRKW